MIDTVPAHASAQPENAIILPKWKGDPQDKELISLIPFLEYIPTMATPDVRKALKSFDGHHIPTEFAKREAIARQRFHEQLAAEGKKPRKSLGGIGSLLGMKPQTADGEQSLGEGLAQGKMLQDLARERGQREYERLEKMIREEGPKWLAEEAATEEKMKEEAMKGMKNNFTGFFGGGQK
jgi:import inner membrane translocase subunit TIM50